MSGRPPPPPNPSIGIKWRGGGWWGTHVILAEVPGRCEIERERDPDSELCKYTMPYDAPHASVLSGISMYNHVTCFIKSVNPNLFNFRRKPKTKTKTGKEEAKRLSSDARCDCVGGAGRGGYVVVSGVAWRQGRL